MSTVAGGGGNSLSGYIDDVGTLARFKGPGGILSLSTGDLIVADTGNNIIRKIKSSGTLIIICSCFHKKIIHAFSTDIAF